MKRIDQTILASDPERQGNCLAACVATFCELPLHNVPHFVELGTLMNGEDDRISWWSMLLGFMAGRGLWPDELKSVDDAEPGETVFVMGMSPRGVCHQVLYRNGELWHDPHPSRDGVVDVREALVWRPVTFHHEPTKEAG